VQLGSKAKCFSQCSELLKLFLATDVTLKVALAFMLVMKLIGPSRKIGLYAT